MHWEWVNLSPLLRLSLWTTQLNIIQCSLKTFFRAPGRAEVWAALGRGKRASDSGEALRRKSAGANRSSKGRGLAAHLKPSQANLSSLPETSMDECQKVQKGEILEACLDTEHLYTRCCPVGHDHHPFFLCFFLFLFSLCVYVYICVFVCLCLSESVCVWECVSDWGCMCIVWMCVRMYFCECVYICVFVFARVCVCVRLCLYACVSVCV